MANPPVIPRAMSADPTSGLRGLTELPYRFPLQAAQVTSLGELGAAIRDAHSPEAWVSIYADGHLAAERLLTDVDHRIETQQKQLNGLEDPMEARGRLAVTPRRDAERAVADLRAAIQRCGKDSLDRVRRQQELVADRSKSWLRDGFRYSEQPADYGINLDLDATWWAQLEEFLAGTWAGWRENVIEGVDTSLQRTVSEGAAALATRSEGGFRAPPAYPMPEPRLQVDRPDALTFIEALNPVMAMFRSVKGAAAMFSGMVVAAGAAVGLPVTLTIKACAAVCIAGVCLAFIYPYAQHQRQISRERSIQTWRESITQKIRFELNSQFDRQRRVLERWIEARVEQWLHAVDAWFADRVEPQFGDADVIAQERVREIKLQQTRLQDELTSLRSLRSQLAQTILPDLRRRYDELVQTNRAKGPVIGG